MEAYRILTWDSNFFGFRVARICSPDLTVAELDVILRQLARAEVKLAYWSTYHDTLHDQITARGGRLVDLKTTFSLNLDHAADKECIRAGQDEIVESYDSSMRKADLRDLAIQSGEYSRFAVDPKIPRGKFEEMYEIWMEKSLIKDLADEVLVIREQEGRVVGMTTLRGKAETGDIGLLAVDGRFRGRGYGEMLVRNAQRWCIKNKCKVSRIITQGKNLPACKLYAKCGYSLESQSQYYHFWIDDYHKTPREEKTARWKPVIHGDG